MCFFQRERERERAMAPSLTTAMEFVLLVCLVASSELVDVIHGQSSSAGKI
jgi:hypothetical protein